MNCGTPTLVYSGLMWNYWNHRRQEKERTRLDEAGVNADLQKSALIAALLGMDHKSIFKLV